MIIKEPHNHSIIFDRFMSNQLTSHGSNLKDNKRTSQSSKSLKACHIHTGSFTIIKWRHRKYHNHKEVQEVSQSLRDSMKFHNHREAHGSFTIREVTGNDIVIKRSQGVSQSERIHRKFHNHDRTWMFCSLTFRTRTFRSRTFRPDV